MAENYTPPNPCPFKSFQWYEWTHREATRCHDHFVKWLLDRGIQDCLEIGCGKYGYYARMFGTHYTGLDVDPRVIEDNKRRHEKTGAKWISADIMTYEPKHQYDLVFSRSVIDHMPDANAFIVKCCELSRRYVYIMSYRGFFDTVQEHKQEQGADGIFYNNVSVPALRTLLNMMGARYVIHQVETGRPAGQIQQELHIEINIC